MMKTEAIKLEMEASNQRQLEEMIRMLVTAYNSRAKSSKAIFWVKRKRDTRKITPGGHIP